MMAIRSRANRLLFAATLLICGLCIPLIAFAVVVNPDPILLQQPDGTRFWARNWGDEWQSGVETLDGYTIVRDARTGKWVYAQKDAAGNLVTSPYVVGWQLPVGIPRHLRPEPVRAFLAPQRGPEEPALGVEPAPPTPGTHKLLAIVVDFTPTASNGSTEAEWAQHFFVGGGTYTPRSVSQYWSAASYTGISVVPAAESYGTANDGIVFVTLGYAHPDPAATGDANRQITRDALIAADPFVQFNTFDTNPADGYLNTNELHLYIIVRGYEKAFGGAATCSDKGRVWGHQWSLGWGTVAAPTVDGVVVGHWQGAPMAGAYQGGYMQEGEFHCATPTHTPGHIATIGISAHEIGHDVGTGAPDLYDTDDSSEGIGVWGLQGSGSWNGSGISGHSGSHPALPDPWSRWFFGFITPTEISGTSPGLSLPKIDDAAGANHGVFQLLPNPLGVNWPGSGEYFLVENRQQAGDFDVALPGNGLLIWHIYEPAISNADEGTSPPGNPRIVVLEQADGRFDLECYTTCNSGDNTDPWKSGTATTFNDASTPNSRFYTGLLSGVSVTNVSASGATMTADLTATPPAVPNDNFANAFTITASPFTHRVYTTQATTEPTDPDPGCAPGRRGKSVWYRFQPLVTGPVTADTFGSNYDTILSVWTGGPGAFTTVACNDDTGGLQSQVSFAGTAGTTYFFMTSASLDDGGTQVFNLAAPNPVPVLSSLSPDSAIEGGPAFTLTVNGSNFISNSVVRWQGADRVTAYVKSTQLTAAIPASDIATAGLAEVTVFNPAPAGGTSNPLTFAINPATGNPTPSLNSLSPSSAIGGGPDFTLSVNGRGFISASVVRWKGADRTTTFVSSTQLTAAITASDIATGGTAEVTVFNPAPGGGLSNAVTFNINNPVPRLSSLSPSSATAGGAAFTLTANGSNFVTASVVRWKGEDRTTTFVSGTQLTASILASDIATSGTAAVTVFNPTPSGGTSNTLTFTIADFTLAASPTSATVTAGQAATYTVTVTPQPSPFNDAVALACSLPSALTATTCALSPTSVTPGASAATSTLTVTTTASKSATLLPPFGQQSNAPLYALWLGLPGIALLGVTFVGHRPRRARLRFYLLWALLLAFLVLQVGCGKKAAEPGTPTGTYTITVTATSGALQHSATAELVVQ